MHYKFYECLVHEGADAGWLDGRNDVWLAGTQHEDSKQIGQ
jgi:hypothetical protein